MELLEYYEGFPLAHIIKVSDEAIANWRKPLFVTGCCLFFNCGMVLIRSLEVWGEWPFCHNFSACIALATLLTHAFVVLWMVRTYRRCLHGRQLWINLRHCSLQFASAETWSSREFFLEQTAAAFERLK